MSSHTNIKELKEHEEELDEAEELVLQAAISDYIDNYVTALMKRSTFPLYWL